MQIPSATYRLQFTPGFRFPDAAELAGYLSALGVDCVYASPVFRARPGSSHGYDIIDPVSLNPELGSDEEFGKLVDALRGRGILWLQDIVPNHMAYTGDNALLMDVLEKGKSSRFIDFFDIDWDHPYESIHGKLLAPFLGKFYGDALESGEIRLSYGPRGLSVSYYELRFPLKIESYLQVLSYDLVRLKRALGADNPDFIKFLGVLYTLKNLPSSEEGAALSGHIAFIKRILWDLYERDAAIREYVDGNIRIFNGTPGVPESFNPLDALLSEQLFRLTFWKVASEELNYRRFFNINDLISLKVEKDPVFDYTHDLIFRLCRDRRFDALRIDHIDGLCNPLRYLTKLRDQAGDRYLVVEKILARGEELPPAWPVQGTTGYDFLNVVNGLFCDPASAEAMHRNYNRFIGYALHYENLVFEKKRLIIGKYMAGDIDELARLMKKYVSRDRRGSDITMYGLKRAIVDVVALFPVYRTYISPELASAQDMAILRGVIRAAKEVNPGLFNELDFIEKFLLLELDDHEPEEKKRQWLQVVMRFQQYTGPLMAKGFEDTALYVYNRLLSLNEVGGDPGRFGVTVPEFHDFCRKRTARWPHSLNATATHDTKRGEDARARINVLSEIPSEWRRAAKTWSRINAPKKITIRGKTVPATNDEYFFYQTLVGSFPLSRGELSGFTVRVKEYIVKAVREAKIYTAWLKPDEPYENGFLSFIDAVLADEKDNAFLNEFTKFHRRIVPYGMLNSLAQTLVKITAPGVPDVYQGTELWDLSMVDPDNRRPVDYASRRALLDELGEKERANAFQLISDLLKNKEDGAIKLFLMHKALQFRRENRALFAEGAYFPVPVEGRFKDNVIAFARRAKNAWAVTVAPRLCTRVFKDGDFTLGRKVWEDTRIVAPVTLPDWKEVVTLQSVPGGSEILLNDILKFFPAALLTNK